MDPPSFLGAPGAPALPEDQGIQAHPGNKQVNKTLLTPHFCCSTISDTQTHTCTNYQQLVGYEPLKSETRFALSL